MVRLFSKFENATEVLRQWTHHFDATPPHLTTFSSKNRKFNENETVETLPHSGRPSTVLFEEKLDEIEGVVTSNSHLSIRQDAARVDISKSSYQVAMEQLRFEPYRPTLIVDFNEDHFDRRSEFCETWIESFQILRMIPIESANSFIRSKSVWLLSLGIFRGRV